MIAWALTYLLHSTILILIGWALARSRWGRGFGAGDAIWKCALTGALLTTTLQQAAGSPVSLALPVHALGSVAPIDSDTPVPQGGMPWLALAWAVTAGIAAGRLAYGWFRARVQPIVGKADLERRIDIWVAYQRRNLSFDPLKPNYDWRRP